MINQDPNLIEEHLKKIPFFEIVLSYISPFVDSTNLELLPCIKDKLECELLKELSYIAEVTLQAELDKFVAIGNANFEDFTDEMICSLATLYPVLDKKLKIKVSDFLNHICSIIERFNKNIEEIESAFSLKNIRIVDIDICLGDVHNGEGTALVHMSDGTKLIYKPRNIGVTHSYNSFINWVNCKVQTDLKTFKVLDCGTYGWIEYIHYEAVSSEQELEEYYYKAGILLAVTLLLGSKDCHHDNLIASGKNPVLIDHETIIQPFFNDKSFHSWDDQHKIPPFSVLESVLIVNKDTGAPLDIVGYGVNGHIDVTDLEKKIINPNTINSRLTTRFITRKAVTKNIPAFQGKYIFATAYKEYFVNGFSIAYEKFLNSKEELLSENSPLGLFVDNEVRYVWRPTFVYFKILKYLRFPSFMSSYDAYNSKLYDLLSRAFKGENRENYKFIMDFEIKQMLNGDVPIFSLDSLNNCLEGNETLKVFEYNCFENINHRLGLFSSIHKNEQLKYIYRWLSQ